MEIYRTTSLPQGDSPPDSTSINYAGYQQKFSISCPRELVLGSVEKVHHQRSRRVGRWELQTLCLPEYFGFPIYLLLWYREVACFIVVDLRKFCCDLVDFHIQTLNTKLHINFLLFISLSVYNNKSINNFIFENRKG